MLMMLFQGPGGAYIYLISSISERPPLIPPDGIMSRSRRRPFLENFSEPSHNPNVAEVLHFTLYRTRYVNPTSTSVPTLRHHYSIGRGRSG